jgi:UDP-3-O-[3-hydroxymyristoyl] glucosamine N-acyltransferase
MRTWLALVALSVPTFAFSEPCLPEFPDACVHPDAAVLTAESLGIGSSVGSRALVGEGVSFGAGAVIASRATIHGSTSGAPVATSGTDFIVGRSAVIGADVQVGNDVSISRGASIGARSSVGNGLSLGYAADIGADAIVGNQVIIGSLVSVGSDAEIADGTVIARSVDIGDSTRVAGILGPEVQLHESACIESNVRIRKGGVLLDRVRVLEGARIGRDVRVGAGAVIGEGAVLRSDVEIAPGAVVPSGVRVSRGERFTDSTGDPGGPDVCFPVVTSLIHHSYNNPADPLSDDSGSGNDGAARSGRVDYSSGWANFNGSSTYNIPSTAGQSWASGVSVAVWIRWSGSAGNYRGVVSNGYATNGSWELRFGRESSGRRLGVVSRGPSGQSAGHSVYLSQNTWHHVAMVHGDGTWSVYLDGAHVASRSAAWLPKTVAAPVTIGSAITTEPYRGDVDELHIFDRAISAEEVADLAGQVH